MTTGFQRSILTSTIENKPCKQNVIDVYLLNVHFFQGKVEGAQSDREVALMVAPEKFLMG